MNAPTIDNKLLTKLQVMAQTDMPGAMNQLRDHLAPFDQDMADCIDVFREAVKARFGRPDNALGDAAVACLDEMSLEAVRTYRIAVALDTLQPDLTPAEFRHVEALL